MIKRNVPNFLTCGNILTGTFGIVEVFNGNFSSAIYYVLIAAGFDFLDGMAARVLKVSSPMGKELDSLADMVSFGALPSLYLYTFLMKAEYQVAPLLALLIVAFSAWRLAKFNIDDRQSDKFIGLPTPANAIMITATAFLIIELHEALWILLIAGSCLLLVANLEMLALKFKNLSLRANIWRYGLVLTSVALILVFGKMGIVMVIPTYILLSLVANFTSKSSV